MRRLACALTVLLLLPASHGAAGEEELPTRALEALRRHAADPDRGVRFAVVQALGRARPLDLDVLSTALADPEWCVRREAAWALRRGGAPALARFVKALASDDDFARESAAWALSSFGADAIPHLRRAFADKEAEVCLEAIASAGRLGKDVGAPLVDDLRVVVERAHSAAEVLEAKDALATLDPAPPEAPKPKEPKKPETEPTPVAPTPDTPPEPEETPPPDPALSPPPELDRWFTRIETVLALGKGLADQPELRTALSDPERDVRIAAVVALDRASGNPVPLLSSALADTNPRVVRAAIKALGRRRAGESADAIAPFLGDEALATSSDAKDALERMGADAVLPTARQIATANYAALHHGRMLFESFGDAGAPATSILAGLLAHDDVNVREIAARCLYPIGTKARAAAPALARALGDRRLCVVANAALALGEVGLSDEAIAALDDPRARVRAYAAFAVGWSLGRLAGTDLPFFEPRLPVLDLGIAGPFPEPVEIERVYRSHKDGSMPRAERDVVLRLAIRSKDPEVAVYAATLFDAESVDVVEAERVIELLLPKGVRVGSKVDFDRLRGIIGSAEMLACVQYAMRARRSEPMLESICGHFHRISRSDDIPGLLWITRNEEPSVHDPAGHLGMPFSRTLRHGRAVATKWFDRDPGPDPDDLCRAWLEAFRKDPTGGFDSPGVWLFRDFRPRPEDTDLLLACTELAESVTEGSHGRDQASLWVLLRCLGFLSDERSGAVLRAAVEEASSTAGYVARAALARRGDADSLAALVAASRDDEEAFAMLMEVAPTAANRAAAARILSMTNDSWIGRGACLTLVEHAHRVGVSVPSEAFLGIEAAVAASPASARRLAAIARQVPGCRTRRIAAKILAGLADESSGAKVPEDTLANEPTDIQDLFAFLAASDLDGTRRRLRGLLTSSEEHVSAGAVEALIRLNDVEGLPVLLPFLRGLAPDARPRGLGAFRRPEIKELLVEWSNDPKADESDRDEALEALARILGWTGLFPGFDAFNSANVARDAIRRGDLAALRLLRGAVPHSDRVWEGVGRSTLAGDKAARADFWSALRTARYRWFHYEFDEEIHTLGADPSVIPHWAMDLDSNCCRISDGMGDGVFENTHDTPYVYDRHIAGVARPTSEFVRDWMAVRAGRFVRTPIGVSPFGWKSVRFTPEPE